MLRIWSFKNAIGEFSLCCLVKKIWGKNKKKNRFLVKVTPFDGSTYVGKSWRSVSFTVLQIEYVSFEMVISAIFF